MKKLSLCLLVVCFLAGWSSASNYSRTVSYDDQLVIRCDMQSDMIGYLLSHDEVDVWAMTGEHADVRLHYSLYQSMRDQLPECTVLHASVEALVQQWERNMEETSKSNKTAAGWFEEYHKYEDIVKWYEELASSNPGIVKFVASIGKSVEGRDLPAIHIGTGAKQIYFQCQIHAREWISGATCMYIANYLAERKDEEVINLLKNVTFIFVPIVNPDGYAYTWAGDRLWRKNRHTNSGSSCIGVDLNRNYDDHWNGGGSSGNPCSETYHGPSAASEPEVQHTVAYFEAQSDIIGAIDWHSYSQLILRPYGWSYDNCPDDARLKSLSEDMSMAIKKVHGINYTAQKIADLYIATGGASDWFYSEKANTGKPHRAAGITIELRDTGKYGFELPPDQIIPTGEENVQAILLFASQLYADPIDPIKN